MKNLSFARVNTKTYNTFLCIILPLVSVALLYKYIPLLLNFKIDWIFTLEFLKLIVIILIYTTPVTYFLSKAYEILISSDDKSRANTIFGLIACCLLIFPLAFIALVVFAKISFFIPIAFTAAIIFIYFRSYKPATI
nr:hypothetical protein [uncultured Mucilaginibacter sp.]